MPNLVAYFEFEVQNPEQFEEDKRAGEGTMQIWTEREPETVEEFNEVTRQIGLKGQFGKVRLLSLFYDENNSFLQLKQDAIPAEEYTLDAVGDTNIVEEIVADYFKDGSGESID